MKNKKIIGSLIVAIGALFIFYAMLQFPLQSKTAQFDPNPENIPDTYPSALYALWDASSGKISIFWRPVQDALGYRLERQMDKEGWVVIADEYKNTHYHDFDVLLNHTYHYRLFLITEQEKTFRTSSYAIYTEPTLPNERSYQPTFLEQMDVTRVNAPFYELHVNDTYARGTAFYLNCERTGANCNIMLNRKFDTANEYVFGYKNGTELFAITEGHNATVSFVQRVNPETSAYTMQINPSGQIIMWYPLYLLSEEGDWGRLALYDNGTVKFVLEDPPLSECTEC